MQYYSYRVKYAFHSDDSASLQVNVGDIVLGSEKVLKEGTWVLVQQSTPPYSHGYVPAHYIERAQKGAFMKVRRYHTNSHSKHQQPKS
jgi:hypothetical protein